jgi:(1->4)-alpha-D-glucan 1-alpha-D-glucosylmutase
VTSSHPASRGRVATYRWQLTPDRGFAAVTEAIPSLTELGISHLYLSPVAEAVPGSQHGYDVTDPTHLRDELGGRAGFERLTSACRAAGVQLLVDIVPNHLAAHEANPWWWDVLRLGAASRYAAVFDIDWSSAQPLVLPVLADHYGRELEAGRLRLSEREAGDGVLAVRYGDRSFPLRPEAEGAILAQVARDADDDVLGVAARVLARAEGPTADLDGRDADLRVAERLVRDRRSQPATRAALTAELRAIEADPDRLDLVLARQHHRLARWTVGDAELDYRRFFDVDALAATRMEVPFAFDLLHELPADLLALDVVDGLRVDHIDGLADPAAYLGDLRELAGAEAWLLVEKILRPDEELPPWPVAGTTGYEVADLIGGWLTDPEGGARLTEAWAERTGERRSYTEVAQGARREVLASGFAADLERVVDSLHEVCRARRRHRDHTRAALRTALAEVAVHLERYRTYVAPDGQASDPDHAALARAIAGARAAAPELDGELWDLVAGVLTGELGGDAESQVVTRFQQLTGPVAAKGEEDTALYRWCPLPHRCEVGADPARPTTSAARWHEAAGEAQRRWPARLTTISTHDSKRSADARARLAALTVDPQVTMEALDAWWAAVEPVRGSVDPATGWLLFHTLVAGWPLDESRAWTVVEKSVREAAVRTSWTAPDERFELDLRRLVTDAVSPGPAEQIVDRLCALVADAADTAALAQLLVQLLAPGVPDLYQGAEGWDRSLVDPDNRRPPDPTRRADLVRAAAAVAAPEAWSDTGHRAAGLPRTIVLRQALAARRRHAAAVGVGPAGAYVALDATGGDAERVLAFGRGEPAALVVVVARPPISPLEAAIDLPGGDWTDVFTTTTASGRVEVDKLLHAFPVALLER